MVKNASKLLYTLAGLAFVAAVLFAAFTGGNKLGMDTLLGPITLGWKGYVGNHVAYVILMTVAATALGLGIISSVFHDGDPKSAADAEGLAAVPAAQVPAGVAYWPVIGAVSVALLALGLSAGPILFVIGIVGVVLTLIEWTVRAWSERATGDAALNAELRNSLMNVFEFPAFGVLALAGIALAMWKIMLALPSVGSIIVFAAVPAIVLAFGTLLIAKPKVSQSVIVGVIAAGVAALIIGGVAAAVAGERDHGHHDGMGPQPTVELTEAAN